jgi:hypothetical protein
VAQILDTIAEIQERHDAVRDMERKLLELHQIFMDMAVLVEAQGELLDNIEVQVSPPQAQERPRSSQTTEGDHVCTSVVLLQTNSLIFLHVVNVCHSHSSSVTRSGSRTAPQVRHPLLLLAVTWCSVVAAGDQGGEPH